MGQAQQLKEGPILKIPRRGRLSLERKKSNESTGVASITNETREVKESLVSTSEIERMLQENEQKRRANAAIRADAERILEELDEIEKKLKEGLVLARKPERIISTTEHELEEGDTLEVILQKSLNPKDLEDALLERINELEKKLKSNKKIIKKERLKIIEELDAIKTKLLVLKIGGVQIGS